jgi:DNA-binding NarL/FixJ family response regulator
MNVKLLLVDDHPTLLHGLRGAMTNHPHLTVLGEALTGAMALKLAAELAPDLVVMDVHLPDIDGIAVARQVREAQPSVKVIIFSGDASPSLVDDALQAGACGYILKGSPVEELINAIDVVMAGKLYLSASVGAGILEGHQANLRREIDPLKPMLSNTEKQLMRLIAVGLKNKEIAMRMKLKPNSIEAYRLRLTKKLGFRSVAELVRFAIREGIAPL